MLNKEDIQKWFPSEDGNESQRVELLTLIEQLLFGFDQLKDPNQASLKGVKNREGNFYDNLIQTSEVPTESIPMKEVIDKLLELMHSHPYQNKYYLTNVFPLASIPGLIGMLTTCIVNGNNIWDVYAPAGTEAEVRTIAMLSKLIGYESGTSGGYTTWGGQGAVFTGLRVAIAKHDPNAFRLGVPQKLYAFCSEAAHYSLFKSMEATGIGSSNLIRVRTLPDSSMDLADLRNKTVDVIQEGGTPIYIVATTGTTDAMGFDDVEGICNLAEEISSAYGIPKPHIHADSAIGGFFAFFNNYNFSSNPLSIGTDALNALRILRKKALNFHLADSLCFDFHKLGQSPYATSLFLVKEAADLKLLDLAPTETPYIGHRGYGQYHTGYTLECSRMASAISIYSALLAFGIEGYQRILAQYIEVNIAFRKVLMQKIPEAVIVNRDTPGLTTLFRIYPEGVSRFAEEINGQCTKYEVEQTNHLNELLFDKLGMQRDQIFFGDTKKHLLVSTIDKHTIPLYAAKLFIISPYTQIEHIDEIVNYLKPIIESTIKQSSTTVSR